MHLLSWSQLLLHRVTEIIEDVLNVWRCIIINNIIVNLCFASSVQGVSSEVGLYVDRAQFRGQREF